MSLELLLPTIILVLAALFVANAVIAAVYNFKLMRYLKHHQEDQWQYLSTIGPMGPGASNPFRWFPYIFNKSEEGDENVLIYKKRIQLAFGSCGIILILFLIVFAGAFLSTTL